MTETSNGISPLPTVGGASVEFRRKAASTASGIRRRILDSSTKAGRRGGEANERSSELPTLPSTIGHAHAHPPLLSQPLCLSKLRTDKGRDGRLAVHPRARYCVIIIKLPIKFYCGRMWERGEQGRGKVKKWLCVRSRVYGMQRHYTTTTYPPPVAAFTNNPNSIECPSHTLEAT